MSDFISVSRFRELLRPLSAGAGKPWSGEQVNAWYGIFKGFDELDVARGVARLALTRKNAFVEPSDLMNLIAEDKLGRLPDAGAAYAEVSAALLVWSPYCIESCQKAAKMLSPLTAEALKAVGGFKEAFEVTNRQVFIGQFNRAYEKVARRAVEMRVLPAGLRPKAIEQSQPKRVESRPMRSIAVTKPRAALPAPVDTTVFARKVGRHLGESEPVKVHQQTEEEAEEVKRKQIARQREELQKKKKGA